MSWFDKFASSASRFVSRAPFFAFCVLLVLIWLPSYFVFKDLNTWQLIINTITTVVTFLLVALLQNAQAQFENAVNGKLNAIADFMADLADVVDGEQMSKHIQDLREAVGLEDKVGA